VTHPKVSVIIPTYNRAATVPRAIDSVLAQTLNDLEVIVIDDGSSDDTGRILSERYGDRIRYYNQQNQGASAARNRGIEEARGEWIAFLDSDDIWEKDKLEWQFRALQRFAPACYSCYTDTRFFNHPETRTMFEMVHNECPHQPDMGINEQVLIRLVRPGGAGMLVCLSSLLVHADLVRQTGGFDRKLLYSQDSEFMFRLALNTGFCYVNRPLVHFDRSPAEIRHVGIQAEWNNFEFWLRDSQSRLEGLLRLSDAVPGQVRDVIRERLSTVYSGWANLYLETGDYSRARAAAFKAARLDFTFRRIVKCFVTCLSPALALRTLRQRRTKGAVV
jgi:glycosyltransferase involved in cell wall biosynthesis